LKLWTLQKGGSWKSNSPTSIFKTLEETWMKTDALRFAVAGFGSTGIYPFNPDALPERAFARSCLRTSVTLQRQPRPIKPIRKYKPGTVWNN
jgi:hypothetical protein